MLLQALGYVQQKNLFKAYSSYHQLSACYQCSHYHACLIGLVVKASTSTAEDEGFDSRLCCGDFSGSNDTSDLKTGTQVATLPGAWYNRVSAGTGQPSVSILRLGELLFA